MHDSLSIFCLSSLLPHTPSWSFSVDIRCLPGVQNERCRCDGSLLECTSCHQVRPPPFGPTMPSLICLTNHPFRTIVAAMFIESLLVYGRLLDGYWVVYDNSFMFKLPPQLWRLLSSFLLTGGGFSFVFDLYFTWLYGTGLELNSPRFTQPGDFFTYVAFVEAVIYVSPRSTLLICLPPHISARPASV